MDTKVQYYVLSDDEEKVIVGPEDSIDDLREELETAIDDGDIDINSYDGEEDFLLVATIGYITVTKKTKTEVNFLSDSQPKKGN